MIRIELTRPYLGSAIGEKIIMLFTEPPTVGQLWLAVKRFYDFAPLSKDFGFRSIQSDMVLNPDDGGGRLQYRDGPWFYVAEEAKILNPKDSESWYETPAEKEESLKRLNGDK